MISERPRNIIVGLTILVALALCMYGIVLLGKLPVFSVRQYMIILVASNANGITSGSRVELNGVQVGQVRSAYLTKDTAGKLVVNAQLLIDPNVDIPASAVATMQRSITGVGTPSVSINTSDSAGKMLAKDGTATITAVASDSSLIPKEVFEDIHLLKEELTAVTRDLHALLVYTPPEALENVDPKNPNAPRANASTVIIRLDRTLASLHSLLTDPKVQGSFKDAIQNIADASAQLKTTLQKVDTTLDSAGGALTSMGTAANSIGTAANSIGTAATQASVTLQATQKDIAAVAQKLVETLAQLDKSIKQIAEGNGTTGKLVNDPRLYEGILDLSRSLKTAVDDLDFLLTKWKDEGVNLKLK